MIKNKSNQEKKELELFGKVMQTKAKTTFA